MLMYPKMNPIAFTVAGVKVYWYGLMYMLSFLYFIFVGKLRLKKYGHSFLTPRLLDDTLFFAALGTIIGGRLGYCLFYQPVYYFHHPLDIIKTWGGGMSFHGGMIGVFIAIYFFAKRQGHTFFELSDFIAPIVPMTFFFGRMGNFINGELWGRVTTSTLPWMMVFPQSGSMLPRHPSQLYEALGEGIILTILLWIYCHKPRKVGQASGMFMIGYGVIRFIIEYYRQPDDFLQNIVTATGLTIGQWYSVPMILAGIIIYYWATKRGLDLVIKPQPQKK